MRLLRLLTSPVRVPAEVYKLLIAAGPPQRLHWFIARHYLRAGSGRGLLSLITWIAVGGVIVGVAALIIVLAVMTGMQEDLRNKILGSTPHLVVMELSSSLHVGNYEAVVDSINAMDGVVGATPYALSQVSIVREGATGLYSQPANLYGIDTDAAGIAPTDMERQIIEGALDLGDTASGLPPLLMGRIIADRMQILEGDTVLLLSTENLDLGIGGITPTLRQFEVTGTFTTGMYDFDLNNVYARFPDAQELIGISGENSSGIGVLTVDAERADVFAAQLGERLGYPYYVLSWQQQNAALFNALRLEKLVMGLVVFLIVVVAAFNIVGTLTMVVADRTREIGILKTMGMRRGGVLWVFILQGTWIGAVGTAIGASLGVAISWAMDRYELIPIPGDVYFVDHLPAIIDPVDVLTIIAASLLVAFLATIYPSTQASDLVPVEAIRHE